MKLDDFLKPKKVRCINGGNHGYLTDGKVYDVIGAIFGRLKIHNDNGDNHWYDMTCFELVIDSAENPLQKMELTPELEAVEPKFKVGDRVYIPNIKNICTIRDDGKVITSNGQYYCDLSDSYDLCFVLATPENHALLSKLYPHIEFEQPPKPLTGSDLCRAMLDKGWNLVPCVVSDISDSDALNNDNCCLVDEWWVGSFDSCFNSGDYSYKYAVPFDPKTGIPLTEDMLNDIN